MHIILIYEKTIRNQCVATKKRRANEGTPAISLEGKALLQKKSFLSHNARREMLENEWVWCFSIFYYYIVLHVRAEEKTPLNPIASSSIGACWFHEQLQAAAAAAESSFPLFLRFTPLFFSNKNENSVTNHKTNVWNVFSFVFPYDCFPLFRNERAREVIPS